jgi:hypothetical protein
VGFESIELFLLTAEASKTSVLEPQECLHKLHQISYNLNLEDSSFDLVIFDLSHVNEALIQHKSKPVHGIIDGRMKEKRLWTITIITYSLNKIILNSLETKAHRVTDALFLNSIKLILSHDFRS